MTTAQLLITIGAIMLATLLTRFLPFWCFPDSPARMTVHASMTRHSRTAGGGGHAGPTVRTERFVFEDICRSVPRAPARRFHA